MGPVGDFLDKPKRTPFPSVFYPQPTAISTPKVLAALPKQHVGAQDLVHPGGICLFLCPGFGHIQL